MKRTVSAIITSFLWFLIKGRILAPTVRCTEHPGLFLIYFLSLRIIIATEKIPAVCWIQTQIFNLKVMCAQKT